MAIIGLRVRGATGTGGGGTTRRLVGGGGGRDSIVSALPVLEGGGCGAAPAQGCAGDAAGETRSGADDGGSGATDGDTDGGTDPDGVERELLPPLQLGDVVVLPLLTPPAVFTG